MIVEKLLQLAEEDLKKRRVVETRIGLSYTGVLLDDRSLGVAYSFREEANRCCEIMDEAGDLQGNAWDLAKMSLNPRAVDSAVGIATLNATINRDVEGKRGDLYDFLDLRETDRVGMVGNIRPLVERMEEVKDLFIFERNPSKRDTYPDWAVEQLLPKVDVAVITGTSVVNKTIDHLLDLLQSAREVAILGPTTPLAPAVFGETGVTLLGGMKVDDVDRALKIIGQGGGTRKLKEVSRKITLNL